MMTLRAFVSSLLIATSLLGGDLTLAQTRSPASVQFVPPPPPPQGRPIGSRRGGASRGNCPVGGQQLTALAPTVRESEESVWGLTASERPTFWFYLPYALTADRPGEFVLLDDQGNYVYRTAIERPDAGEGIIGVSLPATSAPLAIDRAYHWALLVYCEADNPIFTQGEIQRVLPPVALAQAATDADRAALYASNGIWYDALTTIAELHRANPNDSAIAANWQSLMQSVELDELIDRPVLSCCTAE